MYRRFLDRAPSKRPPYPAEKSTTVPRSGENCSSTLRATVGRKFDTEAVPGKVFRIRLKVAALAPNRSGQIVQERSIAARNILSLLKTSAGLKYLLTRTDHIWG
jgi:hypothetical protein